MGLHSHFTEGEKGWLREELPLAWVYRAYKWRSRYPTLVCLTLKSVSSDTRPFHPSVLFWKCWRKFYEPTEAVGTWGLRLIQLYRVCLFHHPTLSLHPFVLQFWDSTARDPCLSKCGSWCHHRLAKDTVLGFRGGGSSLVVGCGCLKTVPPLAFGTWAKIRSTRMSASCWGKTEARGGVHLPQPSPSVTGRAGP